ncbi:MAG: DUF4286 family protein [Bacteroidota bacterium]|nr:DUF4286 family protein [Bacteroidota bacterium]MEC8238881.1 DUF4286 family protein [Bacteroidota bacterium]
MHILNITLSVDPTVQEDFVAYVTTQLIPTIDQKSSLFRIHSDANTHPTFGLQIEFYSSNILKDFKNGELEKTYEQLQASFPNKWVCFDTELEKLSP